MTASKSSVAKSTNGARAELEVSIGLTDGSIVSGCVSDFKPAQPELVLMPVPELRSFAKKRANQLIVTENIAFVAFYEKVYQPRIDDIEVPLKLRLVSGELFDIRANQKEISQSLGFFAAPVKDTSYKSFFFYSHGISRKELNDRLGDMLVQEGILEQEKLDQSLSEQQNLRSTKLGELLVEKAGIQPEALKASLQIQQRRKLRLGQILIETQLANQDDIEKALAEQKHRKGIRLGQILIERGVVSEHDLTQTLARKFHMRFVNLDEHPIEPEAAKGIPSDLLIKHVFLPLRSDDSRLEIAIGDPLSTEVHDLLRFRLNKQIHEVVAVPAQLAQYIERFAKKEKDNIKDVNVDELLAEIDKAGVAPTTEGDDETVEPDSTIIRLANQILVSAYSMGASDIHVEPNGHENELSVRFRVDGQCFSYRNLPSSCRQSLVARLKIMAQLDISEKRKPQDGKITFQIEGKKVELRVATIPTVGGEDVVLRILASSEPLPLAQMALSKRNLEVLKSIIVQPYGLFLCVGPTGSGKTTSLHSALGEINKPNKKIWTAEDPVEITQAGLRQVQVTPRIGFTFANALRAFLRADPDVVMIGEMRDLETANIAVEASLTGHMVLSTLHTNSAPETITRLLDIGLEPFSFADALLGVLAQRLARRLCSNCKEPFESNQSTYNELAKLAGESILSARGISSSSDLKLWKAVGCEKCGKTGYRGRIGIHELMAVDESIRESIQHKAPVSEMRDKSIASGMTTLLQDGIDKVLAGDTDLTQILAVCSR